MDQSFVDVQVTILICLDLVNRKPQTGAGISRPRTSTICLANIFCPYTVFDACLELNRRYQLTIFIIEDGSLCKVYLNDNTFILCNRVLIFYSYSFCLSLPTNTALVFGLSVLPTTHPNFYSFKVPTKFPFSYTQKCLVDRSCTYMHSPDILSDIGNVSQYQIRYIGRIFRNSSTFV